MRWPAPYLGDVVVRARGLTVHLLPRDALVRLARSSGSGVLAAALQAAGYWPAPSEGGVHQSTAAIVNRAIEHETARRLGVLSRWLGGRRAFFAGVFEDEERRALRIWLRRISSGATYVAPVEGTGILPRRLREELAKAGDLPAAVRALARARSPFAEPLANAVSSDAAPEQIERALDYTFALRARRAAARIGGSLVSWVCDGIDLENAWGALLGERTRPNPGGTRLLPDAYAVVASEPSERVRRRRLAAIFAGSAFASVFDDPDAPLATLESRATAARIGALRMQARIDPIGPAPILEAVLRLRAERTALRRINWGIAQDMPAETIIGPEIQTL